MEERRAEMMKRVEEQRTAGKEQQAAMRKAREERYSNKEI